MGHIIILGSPGACGGVWHSGETLRNEWEESMVSQYVLRPGVDGEELKTANIQFKCLRFAAQVREHPSLEKGSGER